MRMTCKLPDHALVVEALLEGFVLACQVIVESGLAPPDPLDTEVRYQLEPPGQEDWKLPQDVIRDGWGDCEDVAGWRAGGMRATGVDPGARVIVVTTGKNKLHAVVQLSNGELSDPSIDLKRRQTSVGAAPTRGRSPTRDRQQAPSWGRGASSSDPGSEPPQTAPDRGGKPTRIIRMPNGPTGNRKTGKQYDGTRSDNSAPEGADATVLPSLEERQRRSDEYNATPVDVPVPTLEQQQAQQQAQWYAQQQYAYSQAQQMPFYGPQQQQSYYEPEIVDDGGDDDQEMYDNLFEDTIFEDSDISS